MPVYQPFRKPHNDLESLIHGSLVSSLKPLRCDVPNRYHLVLATEIHITDLWLQALVIAYALESSGVPMPLPSDFVYSDSRDEYELVWFIIQYCRDLEASGKSFQPDPRDPFWFRCIGS